MKGQGNLWRRFKQLRRDLIAALYGAYDETVTDAENPERIDQTRDMLEAGSRTILRREATTDALTIDALAIECGRELQNRLGEYIRAVYVREDAPVDGQLWKEGRGPETGTSHELPPGVTRLPTPDLA